MRFPAAQSVAEMARVVFCRRQHAPGGGTPTVLMSAKITAGMIDAHWR
jgi:hypothetical protein